jgi:hypothetical protein
MQDNSQTSFISIGASPSVHFWLQCVRCHASRRRYTRRLQHTTIVIAAKSKHRKTPASCPRPSLLGAPPQSASPFRSKLTGQSTAHRHGLSRTYMITSRKGQFLCSAFHGGVDLAIQTFPTRFPFSKVQAHQHTNILARSIRI